jgi:hypothetical protein
VREVNPRIQAESHRLARGNTESGADGSLLGAKGGKCSNAQKYGELPEAEEADRLSTGEAAQAPDVKPVCQRSPVIISQSVDVPEHADDRCGYGRLVVAEEATEDEVGNPLTIPQLRRGLLYLPPQEVPQITDLQGRKLLTHNGGQGHQCPKSPRPQNQI